MPQVWSRPRRVNILGTKRPMIMIRHINGRLRGLIPDIGVLRIRSLQFTNLDIGDSDPSSMSSTSYVPIVPRFNDLSGATRKRKPNSETSSQGHSRSTKKNNKEKKLWSQRSHKQTAPNTPSVGNVLNHSLMTLALCPNSHLNLVELWRVHLWTYAQLQYLHLIQVTLNAHLWQ